MAFPAVEKSDDQASDASQTLKLSWRNPAGMIALSLWNFLLRVITLNIYSFWAKTEVRRRIWSAARLNGEPLVYTGTGGELFIGFLIVFGMLLLPVILGSVAIVIAFGPQSPLLAIYQVALTIFFLFLVGVGTYRAQRYRLSRTRWRGIRGAITGSSLTYGWTYFWTALLIPLTLGWIIPWRATKLQSILTNDMTFGSLPFTFNAGTGHLYARFAVLWTAAAVIAGAFGAFFYVYLLPIAMQFQPQVEGEPPAVDPELIVYFTLALYAAIAIAFLLLAIFGAWYRAAQFNHFAAHTHYQGATFKGSVTASGFIWLGISNFLISILSLGLLLPVVQARTARYMVEHLEIEGHVPLASIAQAAAQNIRTGEGLAEAFDVDAF